MNQDYEIVETYIGVPTLFTLKVADCLGFATVFLHLSTENEPIKACYINKEVINNIVYSIFEVVYVFKERCANGIANFYFVANNNRYICEEMHFTVIP